MVYVIDTHAIIWFFEDSRELGRNALTIFNSKDSRLIIPTIVIAEIFYLSQKRRITPSFEDVFRIIEQDERCIIYPLDINVIRLLPEGLDIHDGIICGTALVYEKLLEEDVKLITKDKEIMDLGIIATIW